MATKKKAEAAAVETPKAPACDHIWIGTADGVECQLCHQKLTAKEFAGLAKKGN